MSADQRPLVTVVMAVRNEADFIRESVQAVLDQDYPASRLEVIVADGASTDSTRQWLDQLAANEARLSVVDNPEAIVPTGLNAAIQRSKGDVIIRVDGHCAIAPDFVSQSVQLLSDHDEAWAVGGPIAHRGRTSFGRAAAYSMSSRIGVGDASHRFESFEGYSDSVAFPAFRRSVFDRIGYFDEGLVRNQDDELNFRITQHGGKIYVSPRVKYQYYVRDQPAHLFRQYFQYAFWRIPMLRKHGRPTTGRQIIPPLFFAGMAGSTLGGILIRRPGVAVAVPAMYAVLLLGFGATSLRELEPNDAIQVPLAVAILHSSYAAGWFAGLYACVFKKDAWDRQGAQARLSR